MDALTQVQEALTVVMFVLGYNAIIMFLGWAWAQADVNYYRNLVYAYECKEARKKLGVL